ncbi:PAS domain S-box protein [Bacillus sp. FJAT-42376]|uniref:PAS domain S-box protein n=1 Tax=Bacillus sp. FJAT-42376 TaxID=2014076 RepID=UPI000F5129D0|nr:PAS domain S-box protein [Bacillus sp. FJAT-42376]AZB42524.1 PAS domain S-box protein [Bacillus sp. FJAT-42376]
MSQLIEEAQIARLNSELNRLKNENKQLKSELSKHQVIFDQALDAIIIFDQDMNFKDANEAACKMFEEERETLLKESLYDYLAMFPNEEIKRHRDQLSERGSLNEEIIIKLKNGQLKFIEFSAKKNAIGSDDLSIMRDVSSKKMLERERSINEKMFQDLFHRALDGIVIYDHHGRLVDANTSFCQNFEIQKNQLSSYRLKDFIDKESHFKIEQTWKLLSKSGKAKGDLPVRLKSGTRKIFEFTTTANILNGYYMSIMRDITEKRSMEAELHKSEVRFREIFENAMDAIVIWDKRGRILKANRWATRIFELSMDGLLKSSITDFLDEEDPRYQAAFRHYMTTGSIRQELRFHMPNGQCKDLEFTSKANVFEGQHLTVLRNVSDRNRMEKELRESEEKFRKIFSGALEGIVLFDSHYRIIAANPVSAKIFEMTHEEIEQCNLYSLLFPDKSKQPSDFLAEFQKEEEGTEEIHLQSKNGQNKILDFSLKLNLNENMHLAIFRDVTERKELEERLRKSDTLNVVGELAAGIAHEIRNPMTALKGFIQLLEGSVKDDFGMYFNVIKSELNRIESIITEFLVLAKPQAVHFEQNSIVKIMKDTMELLNAQAIFSNVQLELSEEGDIPSIYCEPNQMKQVFINILKNAIEVMPGGGTVKSVLKMQGPDQLSISIKDEGNGIPEDKLKRLGEPFYTTKDRGTGLGLMVSYKIIEEHRGKVRVESKVGKGTTFFITLPAGNHEVK